MSPDLSARRSYNKKMAKDNDYIDYDPKLNHSGIFGTPKMSKVIPNGIAKEHPLSTKAVNIHSISFEESFLDKQQKRVSKEEQVGTKQMVGISGKEENKESKNFECPESLLITPISLFNKRAQEHSKINEVRRIVKKSPSNTISSFYTPGVVSIEDRKEHDFCIDNPIVSLRECNGSNRKQMSS
jgi:hypothetical protein